MKQCCLCGKTGYESRDCTWNSKCSVNIAEAMFLGELGYQRSKRSSQVKAVAKCLSKQS